jgi:hypothetical protein
MDFPIKRLTDTVELLNGSFPLQTVDRFGPSIIQSDSKLLSGFPLIGHEKPDSNLESPHINSQ